MTGQLAGTQIGFASQKNKSSPEPEPKIGFARPKISLATDGQIVFLPVSICVHLWLNTILEAQPQLQLEPAIVRGFAETAPATTPAITRSLIGESE